MIHPRRRLFLLAIPWLPAMAHTRLGATQDPTALMQVGPTRAVQTIANAAALARPGITIEVDAGQYSADVAVWDQDHVTVRAVGGRVQLLANGASAEGKGIWVVRANAMRVEGFDFQGSTVVDRNGAGIRLERGSLRVRDCRFIYNEMGLLTGNDPATVLEIENSEFGHNQRPDGHNHNLYVGRIARLSVIGSYFHHARTGHLLKSRARVNHIKYNRLTDEAGGTASYELEFPNGGLAFVVGNIVAQNRQTDNPHLISFGAEGYTWTRNEIYLANNTLVNPLQRGGIYLRVAAGANAIAAANNVLLGPGTLDDTGPGIYRNNPSATPRDFQDADAYDYRLRAGSPLIGMYRPAVSVVGQDLNPTREYIHPRSSSAHTGVTHNPGAMQTMASTPSQPE